MLMAIGVANSIRTFAFTPVRQTAKCTITISLMFVQGYDVGDSFP